MATVTDSRHIPSILDQLEADWAADRRTWRPPPDWQTEPALQGRSPAEILDDAHHQHSSPAHAEAVLAVLVRRAQSDDLAAVTAMHMLLPAAKALLARSASQGDPAGQALLVIEDLWQIIRLYPCHRPGPVSINIKLELWKADLAERYGPIRNNRHQRRPISVAATVHFDLDCLDYQLPPAPSAASAGVELLALLCQEVQAGHLDRRDANLIGRCRIADITADELARRSGRQPQSVRRSRQRAENRLRHAVVSTAAA
jgi:hypothetical protein